MEEKNYTGLIPANHNGGGKINAESVMECESPDLAKVLYQQAKIKLLEVNCWHDVAGDALARFQLTDNKGKAVSGIVKKGNLFRIDIPGPGADSGDGYDWVMVEEIEEYFDGAIESIGIRVRPTKNPLSDSNETAHFYSTESTSTFTVTREYNRVTAAVYDRNTKANHTESKGIFDTVRNFVIGITGRITGSKIQWKSLTKGLLTMEK